jgi:hypothetical protein
MSVKKASLMEIALNIYISWAVWSFFHWNFYFTSLFFTFSFPTLVHINHTCANMVFPPMHVKCGWSNSTLLFTFLSPFAPFLNKFNGCYYSIFITYSIIEITGLLDYFFTNTNSIHLYDGYHKEPIKVSF